MSLKKKGELCVGGALKHEVGGTRNAGGNGGGRCRRGFYCDLLD